MHREVGRERRALTFSYLAKGYAHLLFYRRVRWKDGRKTDRRVCMRAIHKREIDRA